MEVEQVRREAVTVGDGLINNSVTQDHSRATISDLGQLNELDTSFSALRGADVKNTLQGIETNANSLDRSLFPGAQSSEGGMEALKTRD